MKIRHNEIDGHITSSDAFEGFMEKMVEMYATCPDASKIRFIQAIEDRFKEAAPSRGRAITGSSGGGTGWRSDQKAQFSGRGAKWIKLTGKFQEMVLEKLKVFENDGEVVENYRRWVNKAGYAWVRYSGPRGTEVEPELAFEIRVHGSKIDHPKLLIKFTASDWYQFEENREVLGGTPFGMNLED
jgi:hypothetical protein